MTMTRFTNGMRAIAAVLLLAACNAPNGEVDEPAAADREAEPADSRVEDEQGTTTAVCLEGEHFVADGAIPARDATPADADQVAALRWEPYDLCERLVIDLAGADGADADRAGEVTAEALRDRGVVRIGLRDVEQAVPNATDAAFDGPLARAAYAILSPDGGWVYVDVHLGAPAEAFVATLDDPARVVVDLRPGGGPVPEPAPAEDRVVVLEPRPGPATYPLTVTGYARTFEANVVVRLEQAADEVYEDFTTATAWADAWGHYTFTIPEGPSGQVVLHVGEHSARDGTWEGVAVPLQMR